MTKTDRQIVFNKCGGKCAYCGCELEKGWHVDHVEACRRLERYIPDNYYNRITGEVAKRSDWINLDEKELFERFEWKQGRHVFAGYSNPNANHIDNYMPSCPSCNINKHGDTIEQFREAIKGYLNSLNLRMVQYKMVKKYGLVEETNKHVIFYFETLQNQSK